MSAIPKKTAAAATMDRRVAAKWSKTVAESGWTSFPNVIFERQQALQLTPLDINILLHLAGNWWNAGSNPYRTKKSLALAIGVHPRTIQKRIEEMERWGYIKRIYRKAGVGDNLPNEYDFSGLIEKITPFAKEKLNERAKAQAEKTAAITRKRPLTVIAGGK
jgi:DNA-binding MarR family transcriptional regulator